MFEELYNKKIKNNTLFYFINLTGGKGDIFLDLLHLVQIAHKSSNENILVYLYQGDGSHFFKNKTLDEILDFYRIKKPNKNISSKSVNVDCNFFYEQQKYYKSYLDNHDNRSCLSSKVLKFMYDDIKKIQKQKRKISYIFYSDYHHSDLDYKSIPNSVYFEIMKLFDNMSDKIQFSEIMNYAYDDRSNERNLLSSDSQQVIEYNYKTIMSSELVICSEGFWSHVSAVFGIPTIFYTKHNDMAKDYMMVNLQSIGCTNIFDFYFTIKEKIENI